MVKIAIISDPEELAEISSSIDSELAEFGVNLDKDESGEFHLSSDKDIVYLQKIVDTKYQGVCRSCWDYKTFHASHTYSRQYRYYRTEKRPSR